MALIARQTAIQIQLEATAGQDPGGWGAQHVIPAMDVSDILQPDQVELDEFGGSLDRGRTIMGALRPQVTCRLALRGSGTPAVPLDWMSALFQAAAFAETRHTATIPTSGTTTAASGTARSVTFPTAGNPDWPNTTAAGEALIGRVCELSGNPATATTAPIIDYVVASGNITVTFGRSFSPALSSATQVRVLTGTRWITASPSPQPSLHVRVFRDGVMQRYTECRATMRMTFATGRYAEADIQLRGGFAARTDVATPIGVTPLAPPLGRNAYCTVTGGSLTAAALAVREASVDLGMDGQYPEDIHAPYGIDSYIIGSRRVSGQLDPLLTLVATRNVIPELQAQTDCTLAWQWGPRTDYTAMAGNRFAVVVRSANFTDASIVPDNVVLREQLPWASGRFDGGLIVYHF